METKNEVFDVDELNARFDEEKRAIQAVLAPPAFGPGDTSPSIANIAAALAKAQGEITGAEKDSTNPHFRSQYADLASVWDACRDALSKNEIAVVQIPDETADGLFLRTMLCHSSGEWIQGRYLVRTQKQDPQGYGSGMTYARRYSLAAMVGVAPKGDDDDGESATKQSMTRKSAAVADRNAKAASTTSKPPPGVTAKKKELRALGDDIKTANDMDSLTIILNNEANRELMSYCMSHLPDWWYGPENAGGGLDDLINNRKAELDERAAIQAEGEDVTGPLRAG